MIRFIYRNGTYDKNKEKVITNVCTIAKEFLSLPELVEVELKDLGKNIYAETIANPRFKNRIRLNIELSLKELIKPLVHELIHLEQIHTNRLSVNRQGFYIWEGQVYQNYNPMNLSNEEYKNLPWELDVSLRENKLLDIVLDKGIQ
jgi:hypothetical protein